jgi:hypothetical protein
MAAMLADQGEFRISAWVRILVFKLSIEYLKSLGTMDV